jgi:hypothetical protein
MNARTLALGLGSAREQKNGFVCRCPLASEHNHDDANPSLSIKDASDGKILVHCESRHSDEQGRVVAELKRLGHSLNGNHSVNGGKPQDNDYQLVQPVPDHMLDDANKLGKFLADKLGASNDALRFPYRDAAGNVLYFVFRFQLPDGKKEIRPATLWRNRNNGKLQWRSKWPPTLSLFLLETLAAHPERPVLGVEGELKAHQAAQALPDRYAVVGLCGGAKAIEKNDLTPLHDRTVVLWPDNDRDGFDAMARVARTLEARQQPIINNVRLVLPDKQWPVGYDIGDLIEKEKWDTPRLLDRLSGTFLVDTIEVEMRRRFSKKGNESATPESGTQADTLIAIARAEALFHDDDKA